MNTASIIWIVLAASAAGLWATSVLAPRLLIRPGLLVRAGLTQRWVRLVAYLGWAWLGWHLFAR